MKSGWLTYILHNNQHLKYKIPSRTLIKFAFHIMLISELAELNLSSKDTGRQLFAGTDVKPAVLFPPVVTSQWEEQVASHININKLQH